MISSNISIPFLIVPCLKMGWLSLTFSSWFGPWLSFTTDLFYYPVSQAFRMVFGSVCFKHKLIKGFVFKNSCVKPCTLLSNSVATSDVLEQSCWIICPSIFAIHNTYLDFTFYFLFTCRHFVCMERALSSLEIYWSFNICKGAPWFLGWFHRLKLYFF